MVISWVDMVPFLSSGTLSSMGSGNRKRTRRADDLARKQGKQPAYERALIVCEGTKTEPQYLEEIRIEHRLSSTSIRVLPAGGMTSPIQVVEYARDLFNNGEPRKGVQRRAFDRVFAVFDRDDHASFDEALRLAASLEGQLRNDFSTRVPFSAVVSDPCFELWLLLHFEDVRRAMSSGDVQRRLRTHIPGYAKGSTDHYSRVRHLMDEAMSRADRLRAERARDESDSPYSCMPDLVRFLLSVRKSK